MHWLGPVQSTVVSTAQAATSCTRSSNSGLYCWQTVHKYCHFHCLQIQSRCSGSICGGSVQFPLDIDCGKVHSVFRQFMMSLAAKVSKPQTHWNFRSQDSWKAWWLTEPAAPGPQFHLWPEAPRTCMHQRAEEEHWQPREYPRNLLEMGVWPASTAIPDASWNLRHMVVTLFTTSRICGRFRNFINSINLYKMCMYTLSWGGLPQWAQGPNHWTTRGNSYLFFFF